MTEPALLFSSHLILAGERSALYERARSGALTRVTRGCWVETSALTSMTERDRHLLLCRAVAVTERVDPMFSHISAVAAWKLPLVGSWPSRAHVLQLSSDRGRSTSSVVRHVRASLPDPILIDGLRVTPLPSTVVEVASAAPFETGVTLADAALRQGVPAGRGASVATLTKDDLWAAAAAVPRTHGAARLARVIEFADPAADRPGESLSRVSILRAGLTPPLLQVPLRGASGLEYFVDFFWPEFNVIGEFDGKAKYTDPEFLRGRSPQQALYDEKLREDDLRAVPHRFTRWNWSVAISPAALGAHLRRAGVR